MPSSGNHKRISFKHRDNTITGWLIGLLVFLVLGSVVVSQVSAETIQDFQCDPGTTPLSLNQMSITSANGGWLNPPTADAARLIDNAWSAWAPNYYTDANATIDLGGTVNIADIHIFTSDGASGTFDVTAVGNSNVTHLFTLNQSYKWLSKPFNTQASQLKVARSAVPENVIEIRVCLSGTPPNTHTPTPTQPVTTGGGTSPSDFFCDSGLSAVPVSQMSVTSASGGWYAANPIVDANRLIDSSWSGWAPNYDDTATATISFGSNINLQKLYLFTMGGVSGTIQVQVPGQASQILVLESGFHWMPVSFGGASTSQVTLTRNDSNENIVEVRACAGNGGPISTPTPILPTITPTQPPGATPIPTMTPSPTPIVPGGSQPQSAPPSQSIESAGYGNWVNKLDSNMLNALGQSCIDLHDRFWVLAEDGKAYHTWHPPVYNGCQFGHEHGTNPENSDIYDYAGGHPAFGFVMAQQNAAMPNMPRHEDHFGHKVTVANNIRLAIGNSAGEDGYPNIFDADITCDWLSKIHMGTYSVDALTNQMHEYFLSVRCDDEHQGQNNNTEFSVKLMAPWGDPNRVVGFEPNYRQITPVLGQITSQITKPHDNSLDVIMAPHLPNITGAGGDREFKNFNSLRWNEMHAIDQPELWAMHSGGNKIEIPGGGNIRFAPYYITKNPSRILYDNDTKVIRTVDACYENGQLLNGAYCDDLPQSYPGSTYWKTADSPFNGGMRAVQFKGMGVTNQGGPAEFCTDSFGKNPTNLPCSSLQIRQKSARIRNYWLEQSGANSQICIKDVNNICHQRDLGGSIEKAEFSMQGGQLVVTQGTADPYPGGGYYPAGIGFEWFVDHSEDPGIHPPN